MSHSWSSFLISPVHEQSAQSAGLAGNAVSHSEKPSVFSQGGDPNKVTNPITHPRACAPADIFSCLGLQRSVSSLWVILPYPLHDVPPHFGNSLPVFLPREFSESVGKKTTKKPQPHEENWGAPRNRELSVKAHLLSVHLVSFLCRLSICRLRHPCWYH